VDEAIVKRAVDAMEEVLGMWTEDAWMSCEEVEKRLNFF
jgi:hypothetical protein